MFFTKPQVNDLWVGLHEAAENFGSIRKRFVLRYFNTSDS